MSISSQFKKTKTPFFPVFFLVTCNVPSFLVSGWDALMFFAEDQCYSLWGKHWLLSWTRFGPFSQIPTESWLVKLKVWFWLFSREGLHTCSLSSSQEWCKWRQRDFPPRQPGQKNLCGGEWGCRMWAFKNWLSLCRKTLSWWFANCTQV